MQPHWFLLLTFLSGGVMAANSEGGFLLPEFDKIDDQPTIVDLSKTHEESSESKISSLLSLLGSLIGVEDISTIIDITKVGLGVVDALNEVFTKVFNSTEIKISADLTPGADRQLLSLFEIVTLRLEQILNGNEGTERSLRTLVSGNPLLLRWEIALDTIEDYIKRINNLYHKFSYYQKYRMKVENHTLIDFAESATSHQASSILDLMANIHSMVSPSDPPLIRGSKSFGRDEYDIDQRVTTQMSVNMRNKLSSSGVRNKMGDQLRELSLRPSIFRMLENAIEAYDACTYDQSPQQLVFGFYTLIAVTLARAYTMVDFSYNILRYHNKGNFNIELQLTKELYNHYSEGLLRNTVSVLRRAPTSYRVCDPRHHTENETYVMITELLQGYIENEVDLNPGGACTGKCASYEHAKVEGCYLPDTQYCGKHRRCKGEVHECKFFHADSIVCISPEPYRRYDWVKYEDRRMLGVDSRSCKNTMVIDSWWRFLYHCSYCLCLCDDERSPTSDRFVSLRPAVSDVVQNKVITGIKFVKKNRVLHMQVQEGKAIAQAQVDSDTLRWVPVEDISVENGKYEDGVDFVTLRFEKRNFDLDQLNAPKGHVVTGVKFRMLGAHVNFELWVTPINFTTGKMFPESSFWVSNDNTPVMTFNPRQEIKLFNPDDPRRSHLPFTPDSRSEAYVKLQPTSLYTDVSQLTVPFFDAQPVSPYPPTWVQSIQIYHRGRKGNGGFIGFKVSNYNLTRHFPETVGNGF